jgi:hypothetical protein
VQYQKLALVVLAWQAGCGRARPVPGETLPAEIGPPPAAIASLNAAYTPNGGLLSPVGADGLPITTGGSDPMLAEAERFYAAVQAPPTLDQWKAAFQFPARAAGEDRQAYRDRANVAVYYNRNELGLGRELACSRFVDGRQSNGAPIEGIACYVTNHGAGFRQEGAALQSAIAGTDVRNTVSISYRPTLGAGYEVQFYVYGSDGRRQDWARLDTLGPRPHPQVCMTCHGGGYDSTRHLAKNARFLPLDPGIVVFADTEGAPPGVTRAGQEERIRTFNALTLETNLTDAQRALVAALYPDGVQNAGATAQGDGVPAAWRTNDADRDFYRGVVKPYCGTCHLAAQQALGDADLWSYGAFLSPDAFAAAPLDAHVCTTFSMPNAQPTSLGFWETPVSVGGLSYPTAADAYLIRRGLTRDRCTNLDSVAGCDHGDSPDALCGGAVEGGAVCDLQSNRCVAVTPPG